MDIIARMSNSIDTMSLGEKFLGSILVTLLGISIVFAALAVLFISINVMRKLANMGNIADSKEVHKAVPAVVENEIVEEYVDATELVAVITAAVAASLNTSTNSIIVRSINRVSDTTPAWAKIGRIDQVNNKL